jgi:ComF family protein
MHQLLEDILDLLFPPPCAACRRRGALLCKSCCDSCRFVPKAANHEQHLRLASPILVSTAGAYVFEGAVREAIHTLKYHHKPRIALPLGDLLLRYLEAHPIVVDAVVPVPLHPDRLKMRGYNQAALLAKRLAQQLGVRLLENEVGRVRNTSQQADLSRAARLDNVHGAFAWGGTAPPPRRVLVIDDVLTTGATVASVAQALHAAGSQEIHALALARGL